ncbi:hypothetical protein BB559_004374 [Furculomyces boomerangus]|uniref:Rap-GAP domain-containing protein n=1 Tax=Furculomyces boomerangus TaxID=61424 RepID=A0A2T9YF16_9FUNG|nr:hypothetical protein BB559_004374 [Furculomyces boomerangus]
MEASKQSRVILQNSYTTLLQDEEFIEKASECSSIRHLPQHIKTYISASYRHRLIEFSKNKKSSQGLWLAEKGKPKHILFLDHGNNQELRIYGFRSLLQYMNSLMGIYGGGVINLFKSSIIIQCFEEEDLYKKNLITSEIVKSVSLGSQVMNLEYEQSIIRSDLLKDSSLCPAFPTETDYYMSSQSVTATRMIREVLNNIAYMSNFAFDPEPNENGEIQTTRGYLSRKYNNFVEVPDENNMFLSHKRNEKPKNSNNNLDEPVRYLMTKEQAKESITYMISEFNKNYIVYFIRGRENKRGLGGVPIPVMRMVAGYLLKYVLPRKIELNQIVVSQEATQFKDQRVLDQKDIFEELSLEGYSKEYPERIRHFLQQIWLESSKSISIFIESVLFGVLGISKSIIYNTGYGEKISKTIYSEVEETQISTLTFFRQCLAMEIDKRPALFKSPKDTSLVSSWESIMSRYFSTVVANIHSNANLDEGWTLSRLSVFYTGILVFRQIWRMSDSEISAEIKHRSLVGLFDSLEIILQRTPKPDEDPQNPYCLGTLAIGLLFECVVEGWLLCSQISDLYWARFEKLFLMETAWISRYHIWANVLQSLTMTLGTKLYKIDDLELLQDYMFSGQRRKGGNRGLKNKLDLIYRQELIDIKLNNNIKNPFLSPNPFIVTSKCSFMAANLVLKYLESKIYNEDKTYHGNSNIGANLQIDNESLLRGRITSNVEITLNQPNMMKSEYINKYFENDFASGYTRTANKKFSEQLGNKEFKLSDKSNENKLQEYSLKNSQASNVDIFNGEDNSIAISSINHSRKSSKLGIVKVDMNADNKESAEKNKMWLNIATSGSRTDNTQNLEAEAPEKSSTKHFLDPSKDYRTDDEASYSRGFKRLGSLGLQTESRIRFQSKLSNFMSRATYKGRSKSNAVSPSLNEVLSPTPRSGSKLGLGNVSSPGLDSNSFSPDSTSFSRFGKKNFRKRSVVALRNLAKMFNTNLDKNRFINESEELQVPQLEAETVSQLNMSSADIRENLNMWLVLKIPFWQDFNLNEDVDWSFSDNLAGIHDIWMRWWPLVEKPLNITNLEAKKIVTMGLAKSWDIKLVLTDRQTASGYDSQTDDKLAFAHWLFELCRGPQESDICSVMALRAISRVFCRTFSPTFSIPPMYQALFYRVILENLSSNALQFEYGLKCLQVTYIECNRIFALDVPGCTMVLSSLTDSLTRIFSQDFEFKLVDEAIDGAASILISAISFVGGSLDGLMEQLTTCPVAVFNEKLESVIKWQPFNPAQALDQLCFLLLNLVGNRDTILKPQVSTKTYTKVVGDLVGALSIICFIRSRSKEIIQNAINLTLGSLFDQNRQIVFFALDNLRAFLAQNNPRELISLLGHKNILEICKMLSYCCVEQIDRFIDTGNSNYARLVSDMLHLLMSYIIIVPSVVHGRNSNVDIKEHRDFEHFLFEDLLTDSVPRMKNWKKSKAEHNYHYESIIYSKSGENTVENLADLKTELRKITFVPTEEYRLEMESKLGENSSVINEYYEPSTRSGVSGNVSVSGKPKNNLKSPEAGIQWVSNAVIVFSFHLMQYFDNYQPLEGFRTNKGYDSNNDDDPSNIEDGDEIMFFGYGKSIVSVIKSKNQEGLRFTVRSVPGKYSGVVHTNLYNPNSKTIKGSKTHNLVTQVIEDQVDMESNFDIGDLIPRKHPFRAETKNTKTLELVYENEADYIYENPKVRMINPSEIDWASYKTSITDNFNIENNRIEKLISKTKEFVYSFKSKEQLALQNIVRADPHVLKETKSAQDPIFGDFRLFLQHLGLFDWTNSDPGPFKLIKPSQQFFSDLKHLDKISAKESIKVAICYVAPNQTTESEILGNNVASTSLAYREFVRSLGWPVDLENFSGYTGKLHSDGTDGKVAPYFATDYLELIFHDSTEMPTDTKDTKQLKKKRHIGNDFVHIIWNENFCEYRPETITGDFGNAQIHIRPLPSNIGNYGVSLYFDPRIEAVGPLAENMVLSPDILSNVVRSWAISAHRQTLWMRLPKYYHPFLLRRDSITQTINKHSAPGWTDTSYPSSFLVNPGAVARSSAPEDKESESAILDDKGKRNAEDIQRKDQVQEDSNFKEVASAIKKSVDYVNNSSNPDISINGTFIRTKEVRKPSMSSNMTYLGAYTDAPDMVPSEDSKNNSILEAIETGIDNTSDIDNTELEEEVKG